MKRTHNKAGITRKHFVPAAIIVAGVIIVYFASARVFNIWPFQASSAQSSDSSPSPKPHTPSPKNNATTEKGEAQPSIDPGKTSDQVPVSTTMAATITTLEESGQNVRFAATVSNSATAGTCVVTFSNPNDRPVTQQADATVSNGTASCGPIAIPASEFSYVGTWQVTFHYYLDSQQATAQGSIAIQ